MTTIIATILLAAVSVTSDRIGQQAFTFPVEFVAPTIHAEDIGLVFPSTNLTMKSGGVVYSAIEGYAERFLSQYAPADALDLKSVDVLSVPFGMQSVRNYGVRTPRPAIMMSVAEYNRMTDDVRRRMGQSLAVYREVTTNGDFVAYYSDDDFSWCHPYATRLPEVAWTSPSDGHEFFQAGTWEAVDEIVFDKNLPSAKYGRTRPNRWLLWARNVNSAFWPYDENEQGLSAVAFPFGDYLDYTDEVFQNHGRETMTNGISARLDQSFKFDYRLALPLFQKSLSDIGATYGVVHEVRDIGRRRYMVTKRRDARILFGAEAVPSFDIGSAATYATNDVRSFVSTNFDGSAVAALSNGSGGAYNLVSFVADVRIVLDDYAGAISNHPGNAVVFFPKDMTFSGDPCYGEFVNATGDGHGGWTWTPVGESGSDFFFSTAYTNEFSIMEAGVFRSCQAIIPVGVTNLSTASFPSRAAVSACRPTCAVQQMQVKNTIGFVADDLESDPTYPSSTAFTNSGPFFVTGQAWSRFASARARSGSVSVSASAVTNIDAAAGRTITEGIQSLMGSFYEARGGVAPEELLPLEGEPERRVFSETIAALASTRFKNVQLNLFDAVLVIKSGSGFVVARKAGDEWSVGDYGQDGGLIIGCAGGSSSGWGGYDPPEFWWEDEPKWWRGCVFTRLGLWCEWHWGNYRFDDQ